VRRGPLLLGVLVVAVVSGFAVFALGARPSVEVLNAVPVEDAYVGTTYAFDGLVCVGSQVATTRVTGVEVEPVEGVQTQVVRAPADEPPTVGFPVDPSGAEPVDGLEIPAGEPDCGFRVLVTPEQTGQVEVSGLRISTSYGPGGLLRRTLEATPQLTLDVTGTGPDPRSGS
jgi:hypothetical protein